MPTTSGLALDDVFHAKILAYGPSGSGKTTFIGTMPEDRDDHKGRFIINLENKNLLPLHMAGRKFEWEDVRNYERLLKVIVDIQTRFAKKDPSCPATVALDGGGEFYTLIMSYILKNAGLETPQLQNYFTAQERVKMLIAELIALPCHVIVSFHDMIDKDDTTGDILGSVALPGKWLPNDVLKMFNMVLHFEVEPAARDKEPKYKVCTKRTRRYPANDKTGCLDVYEDPDFNIMYKKIVAKYDKIKRRSS